MAGGKPRASKPRTSPATGSYGGRAGLTTAQSNMKAGGHMMKGMPMKSNKMPGMKMSGMKSMKGKKGR